MCRCGRRLPVWRMRFGESGIRRAVDILGGWRGCPKSYEDRWLLGLFLEN
jgi:hypothetical protein